MKRNLSSRLTLKYLLLVEKELTSSSFLCWGSIDQQAHFCHSTAAATNKTGVYSRIRKLTVRYDERRKASGPGCSKLSRHVTPLQVMVLDGDSAPTGDCFVAFSP